MLQWNNAMSYKSLTLVNSKLVLLVFQMRVLAHWRQSKWLSVVWAQSTSSSDVLLRILLFKTLGDNLTKFCTALGCRGLLIIYLEILCPPLKLISPGRLPQSDADNICYFSIIFLLTDDDEIFRGLLESQARQVIKNALNNFSMLDHIPHSSLGTKGV